MKCGLAGKLYLLPMLLLNGLLPLATQAEEEKSWSGSSELGIILTRGNTEVTSAKARLQLEQVLERWTNEYLLDTLFKEDEVTDDTTGEKNTQKTAERYYAYVKSNYHLNQEHSKLFVYLSHTDDQFAGVTKSTTVASGYGHRLFETGSTSLDANIGPGYSFGEKADGEDFEHAILGISAKYQWQISDSAVFTQQLGSEIGEDNIRTLWENSLGAKIHSVFQMKVAIIITHNSKVPEDTEKTDMESTITLVYSF